MGSKHKKRIKSDEEIFSEVTLLLGDRPSTASLHLAYGEGISPVQLFQPWLGSKETFYYLAWGYERALGRQAGAGSWAQGADELRDLAAAANSFGVALSQLGGVALSQLFLPHDPDLASLWYEAGGDLLLADLEEGAKRSGKSVIDLSYGLANGRLDWQYSDSKLFALANLCNANAERMERIQSDNPGVTNAEEGWCGSPKKQLCEHCAMALKACGKPLGQPSAREPSNLKSLARLVHEYVCGEPPPARWAERELGAIIKASTNEARERRSSV